MPPKIDVRAVSKTFHTRGGPVPVLDRLSFSVGDGEFVAVIGPSGCGKSTLLGVLAGFEAPDAGEVRVDDGPVQGPRRKGIFIFQQPSLFPWLDLEGNLVFGLDGETATARRDLVAHYIALVGLEGFERAFPHQLSGGMQQRAELARALMVKPEIIYMDEPFGALDALTRLRMRGELRRILLRERHTVILVTHDVEEALQLADRVLVLSPRPARIQAAIDVTLKHPRSLASADMLALKTSILHELGVDDDESESAR